MATRGWGKARNKATGGFIDPAATKAPEINPKPEFTVQRVNRSKVHHTPTAAINIAHTQRKPWTKLE